jgi:oligopeptide transport system ATP-binding protein
MHPLLSVEKLTVCFDTYAGQVKAVDGISFQVDPGEALGIVGESGCGKSVTAHSIMQLIRTPPGRYVSGEIVFNGDNLLKKREEEMEKIRGNDMSMIFQDPMTSLNPVLTVGRQIAEVLEMHRGMSKKQAYLETVELLRVVGISVPEERVKGYPHQFSGGMRQRVMIAMALGCNPKLLIADEPTTALDVTMQAQILDLMKKLQNRLNMAIILISHDLGVIASLCSRVIVMYAGKIVEAGRVQDLLQCPEHPYTWGLLQSLPRMDLPSQEMLSVIAGQPPDLLHPPVGCSFHPRCLYAMPVCQLHDPQYTVVSPVHSVACWLQHPKGFQRKRMVKELWGQLF